MLYEVDIFFKPYMKPKDGYRKVEAGAFASVEDLRRKYPNIKPKGNLSEVKSGDKVVAVDWNGKHYEAYVKN